VLIVAAAPVFMVSPATRAGQIILGGLAALAALVVGILLAGHKLVCSSAAGASRQPWGRVNLWRL
jgi:hypothetical protein